jgi:C-terminal processing protease CtpA/Prc
MAVLARSLILLCAAALGVSAQMTPEQRLFDFQTIAALYAKRYAPANWKLQSLGVNIFELKPWADQVRSAKSDIEYFEIVSRFVASFRDGHTGFSTPSRFVADLGVYVDIYDGKVLVEQIVRSRVPAERYPFEVGDELVSLDGKPVEEWITELGAQQSLSNPRTTRRAAADAITFRVQSEYPRAAELPDESQIVVRRASGDLETYSLPWTKTGTPLVSVGPVNTPSFSRAGEARQAAIDPLGLLREIQNWSLPAERWQARQRSAQVAGTPGRGWRASERGQQAFETPDKAFVVGLGQRIPYYAPPPGFQVRVGLSSSDPFLTGVYRSSKYRIGLIRIPNFAPSIPASAVLNLLNNEIAFLRANTDGLVVDVTRNNGGGCIGLDYAARLIPRRFWFFGEQLRPTQSVIATYETYLNAARQLGAEQWVIDTYEVRLAELKSSLRENRAMTGPLPACGSMIVSAAFQPPSFEHEPFTASDGTVLAYDKPLIVLVDEFSLSMGDIFPAMMQDNKRGPIVGMRTGGLGGSVSGWPAGFYGESTATNTNSLVVRKDNVMSPDMPVAPFIENVGVIPDIELDYMTRGNLMTRGRDFVNAFTRILDEEIEKSKPQ